MIRLLSKSYLVLLTVFMAYLGFMWLVLPEIQLDKLGISVASIQGINTLKSVMAAGLLMVGVMSILYLAQGNRWLLPLSIFVLLIFISRLSSLIVDGFHPRMGLYLCLEGLVLLALYLLERRVH